MPVVPVVFSVPSAAELESTMNTVLEGILSAQIYGVIIDQVRELPANAKNISVGITYNPNGASNLTVPFLCKTFSGSSESEAVSKLVTFTLANSAYFFSEVFPVYRPLVSDPNEAVCLVIFYHTDSAAARANWGFPTTVPSSALPMSSVDAASRIAYPVSDFDDFNYKGNETTSTFTSKWWSNSVGTAAAAAIVNNGVATPETGVVQLTTGTTTTGRTGLLYGYNLNWTPGNGPGLIRGKVQVVNLPTALEDFAFQFGLMNDTAINGSGAAYFSAELGSSFWQIVYNDGVLTKVPTNVPIMAGAYIDLAITLSEDATSVKYYIDGVQVGVVDLSSFSGGGTYGARIQKIAGNTARTAKIDWIQGILGNKNRPSITPIYLPQ